MTKRRQFSAKFKFQVALDALKGMQIINEIASQNEVHPTQINKGTQVCTTGVSVVNG